MSTEVSTEIAEIEAVMQNDRVAYDRDEAMQSRLRALYDAEEQGAGVPARHVDEIAEIEKIMRTDPRRYFGDEAMQSRYRDLLDAEDPALNETTNDPDLLVAMPSPSEWVKQGGDPADYPERWNLGREINDILLGTTDAGRAQLSQTFEALSPVVQAVAFGEILHRGAVESYPLAEAEMDRLKASPAWRDLIREWGYDAARKAGIVRERTFRIAEHLPDADIPGFVQWIDTIPAEAFKTLARKLAGA